MGMIDALETLIVVAGALVSDEGRVLLQQCPPGGAHAGLWEFPGGKVEQGEAILAALQRELNEELGVVMDAASAAPVSFATVRSASREIILLLYRCHGWAGEPKPIHAAALRWEFPAAMPGLAMPLADQEMVAALAVALR